MKDSAITDPFYLQIQHAINRIDRKASIFNFLFYAVRVILIGIAGAITVITALKGAANKESSSYTVIIWLGAITTALTAADTLFQTDTKRSTYKLMLYDFRALRSEFVHQYYQEKITSDWKEQLFDRYKAVKTLGRDLLGSDSK